MTPASQSLQRARRSGLARTVTRRLFVGAVALAVLVMGALSGALLGTASAQAPDPTGTPTPVATPTPEPTPTPAPNPTPPQPVTGDSSGMTATTATLGGSLTTGGAATTYRFEYGTTTSYGLASPAVSVPAGVSPAAAAGNLTGLTAGTVYHYRLTASNAAGTTSGADRTFTTLAAPKRPAVATRAAEGLTGTAATIVGRVNPYGLPTTYRFEWGLTTAYGNATTTASVTVGPTQTVTAQLTGLQPNTKYVYRVVATNSTGTSRSTSRSFTTGRALTGVSLSAVRRTLSWEGVTVVSGVVRGAVPGGTKVRLYRQAHPFSSPYREVASQTTNAAGAYSFSIARIYGATHLRVVAESTPSVTSPTITLRTRLLARVSISRRTAGTATLRGVVYPAIAATRVQLQRRSVSGRWIRVASPKLTLATSGRATFTKKVSRSRVRAQRYRIVVAPNDGGAHLTTTATSVLVPRRAK
ncbi:MAG: fibronectin type III domain-containing protein [Patulibacter minatonensis]